MSKIENTVLKNWIPISNAIYKNFYYKYDSSAMAVLFKLIARIHNFKGKTYTKFINMADACSYFNISKTPLIRELDILKSSSLIEYEYHRHGHIEIELKLERPSKDFTKFPIDLIKEAQKLNLTANSFSLYMFMIYKFCRPYEKEEQLSYNLKYFAKIIQTSTRTVKNSLQSLVDCGLISCEFAKFQTHDPCIIKPLFFSSEKKQVTQKTSAQPKVTTAPEAPEAKKTEEVVIAPKTESRVQNAQLNRANKTTANTDVPTSESQTLNDLKRVLKRHKKDQEDATLIVKFLNDVVIGLDKQPIKSIPAVWEKDLQSKLKILNFRFSEWKHQQIKEENKQFFKEEAANGTNLYAVVDRSKVQFNVAETTQNISDDTQTKMNNFSNKTNNFSNQINKFSQDLNNFSNNIRVSKIRNLNNHIKGKEPTCNQTNIQTGIKFGIFQSDCDSFNFSSEELEAIRQYKADIASSRLLKPDDFIKRYLSIGVELLKAGKKINLDSISRLYAEKNKRLK